MPSNRSAAATAETETVEAETQTRKVLFRRTLGTIDCRKCGIDVTDPPQEGETRSVGTRVANILQERGVCEPV